MNDIYLNKAKSFFNDLDDRCTLILAAQGMRGHALYRILASHKEVWWDSSIMNDNRSVWYKRDIKNHPEEYNKYRQKLMSSPSDSPLAFNIDVSNLFSDNEESFKTEYERIINHFNFSSNIKDVRSFILTYLEREQSVSIGDY